jgi:hypothetical protein
MECLLSEKVPSAPAASKPQRPDEVLFPDVTWIKGRGYVARSALNRYKAALLGFALGVVPVEPSRVDPDPLVPLKAVAAELGVGRRTIGRRIVESRSGEAA